MFLNIQIHLIILKTYDQQFSLTTKKSLHITFKPCTSRFCLEELQDLWNSAANNNNTTTTILRPFVRDYPGEPVPEETLTHPSS